MGELPALRGWEEGVGCRPAEGLKSCVLKNLLDPLLILLSFQTLSSNQIQDQHERNHAQNFSDYFVYSKNDRFSDR